MDLSLSHSLSPNLLHHFKSSVLCIGYYPLYLPIDLGLSEIELLGFLAIDITPPYFFFLLKLFSVHNKTQKVQLKIITTSLLMMFSFVCIVCSARLSKISFFISLYYLFFSCSKNPSLNNYNKIKLSQFS